MNFVIKIFLGGFLIFGLMTGATIANVRSHMWSSKAIAWLALVHVAFGLFALLLAVKSKPTKDGHALGLSPTAWIVGTLFSYLVGLVGFWFVK